jgi:hypothetical protein
MQGVLVFASSAARAAAITSPQEGQYSYLKDTNSTEYYDGAAWIAAPIGDITGVTAGTGISGGGTSGTVTITNSMATEIAAKGDLIVGTGAATFDNLTVGANGTTLVADSTASTGLKWATPAASTPTYVGASAYKSANQTLTTATFTALTYNTELFDTDAFHDNSTNTTRMTIPAGKAGKYLVTGLTSYAGNATGVRQAAIYKNGSVFAYNGLPGATVTDIYVTNSLVMNLLVADYIEIFGYQNSGGNLVVYGGADSGAFQVTYLGA